MPTYPKGRAEYYFSLIEKGATREVPKDFYDYAVAEGLLVKAPEPEEVIEEKAPQDIVLPDE